MLAQGIPRCDVARNFGITCGRVGMIERQAQAEKAMGERRARLRQQIREADDLDKSWAITDLIDALWLIPGARTALLDHFEQTQQTHVTLREFIDLATADPTGNETEYVSVPLLRIRGIGKRGCYSVLAELTEMDLGQRCNAEWSNRLNGLKRHWRIPSWPPNPRHR